MKQKMKLGADPEYFAIYTQNGVPCVLPPVYFRGDLGVPFSANGRHPIFGKYERSIVHEDGAAFELSVPPSYSWTDLWDTIAQVRELFSKDILSKLSGECEPDLYGAPAVMYEVERWKDREDEFHMANIFGCDADRDVFDIDAQCDVMDATTHPWRYGGGHIHISGIKEIEENPLEAVRSLVITAGLAATAFSDVPDLEKERLFLYGRPGKFRVQRYKGGKVGVEYRTPSNRWTINKKLAEQVFKWVEIGISSLLVGGLYKEISDDLLYPSISSIMNCDQKNALSILSVIESKI